MGLNMVEEIVENEYNSVSRVDLSTQRMIICGAIE